MEDEFIIGGGSTQARPGEVPILAPVLAQGHGWVVLNKPAGLPSHAGPRGGASAEDFFPQLSRRQDGPWLAHRLDTDTAGCLLIALRKAMLVAAQAAFAAGKAGKVYWAVLACDVAGDAGVIDAPLLKITAKSGWRMVADPRGDRAVTPWRVLGRAPGRTWVEFRPSTGRTHQLRVHSLLLGGAIMGDPIYGQPANGLHLLARALNLPAEPPVQAVAPPPPHMEQALSVCGWQRSDAASQIARAV